MSSFSDASKLTNYLRDNFDWQVQEVCCIAYYSTWSLQCSMAMLHMCNPSILQIPNTFNNCLILSILAILRDVLEDLSCREICLMVVLEALQENYCVCDWWVLCCVAQYATRHCLVHQHRVAYVQPITFLFQVFWTGGWADIPWPITGGLGDFYNWRELYVRHAVLEDTGHNLSGKLPAYAMLHVFNPNVPQHLDLCVTAIHSCLPCSTEYSYITYSTQHFCVILPCWPYSTHLYHRCSSSLSPQALGLQVQSLWGGERLPPQQPIRKKARQTRRRQNYQSTRPRPVRENLCWPVATTWS